MTACSAKHLLTGLVIVATASLAVADSFEITSYTIDGGSGYSAGGNFELEGTIGQHDAGPVNGGMVGGAFELTGGFWTGSVVPSCSCLGDMNGDGMKDGADIQKFVDCMTDGGNCTCADVDAVNGITLDDAAVFVESLINGATCP